MLQDFELTCTGRYSSLLHEDNKRAEISAITLIPKKGNFIILYSYFIVLSNVTVTCSALLEGSRRTVAQEDVTDKTKKIIIQGIAVLILLFIDDSSDRDIGRIHVFATDSFHNECVIDTFCLCFFNWSERYFQRIVVDFGDCTTCRSTLE